MSAAPTTPPRSVEALLAGIVDYAGLFPPAGLPMAEAVAEYAQYRSGVERWMLGRFVLAAGALGELRRALTLLPEGARGAGAWRLSALAGPDVAADARRIAEFNARHRDAAVVDAVEVRAATPEEVDRALDALPPGLEVYVEVPVADDPAPLVERVAARGARAKVRTGGVTADAFPTPEQVARFLAACERAGVPFKATAGLHHPVRAEYRLTYEPESPRGRMFGFLNVFLAAAALRAGLPEPDLLAILEEGDPAAFRFDDGGAEWRGRRIPTEAIAETRRGRAIAFGSCSFKEPVEELRGLRLLA